MKTDVLIVGAGLAGTGLAFNLARQNVPVIVVDRMAHYPDAFRAEKIEAAQAAMMRKLHMFEHRVPVACPIGVITTYRAGVTSLFDTVDQYGITYGDTINSLRRNLLTDVDLRVGDVLSISNSDDVQVALLKGGATIRARLVVLATGGSGKLLKSVGMARRYHRSLHSLNVGFDIERTNGEPFSFAGFNYYLKQTTDGVDYVTVFRIGARTRVNVYTQWSTHDARLRLMRDQPREQMIRHFPDLEANIGKFNVCSKIQFFQTRCYRVHNVEQPGVVVIGDEFQSVGPSTGTGLSKVTTDIDVLAHDLVPQWLSTPGMGRSKIAEYYDSPRKRECDEQSLMKWVSYRDAGSTYVRLQWLRVETKVKSWLRRW